MARMWGSGSSSDSSTKTQTTMPSYSGVLASATSTGSLKRKASGSNEAMELNKHSSAKRSRDDYRVATPPDTPPAPSYTVYPAPSSPSPTVETPNLDVDRIADIANEHLGREILLRHQELRFINQELAKCQAALEQLRRCHLIPYPTTHPTPQQMLDIIDGKVPAVQSKSDAGSAPEWAPPYGVVDGPYARHYAKWLIPDPKFDGQVPEWCPIAEPAKNVEGRSTRNSLSAPEGATIGKRVARGQPSQNAPAVTPAAPKGPVIMKRPDGVMVRLVCSGCRRDDFSNVQGFINHERISHRNELKSHAEAAIRRGVPVDESEIAAFVVEEKKVNPVPALAAPTSQVSSGTVHPLAVTESHALAKLEQSRASSLRELPQGRMPEVSRISGTSPEPSYADVDSWPAKSFNGSPVTPSLSRLLQKRGYEGDLFAHVEDAKAQMVLDDVDDDDTDGDDEAEQLEAGRGQLGQAARFPAHAKRVPTTAVQTAVAGSEQRPAHLSLDSTASRFSSVASPINDEDAPSVFDSNVMDTEHSPNTATSNDPPPSLLSDDGGDDSDDGASSDAFDADAMEEDVAEVDPEYHDDHLAQRAAGTSSGTQKKDASKHVTFVTSLPGKPSAGVRRKPNA